MDMGYGQIGEIVPITVIEGLRQIRAHAAELVPEWGIMYLTNPHRLIGLGHRS